MAAEVRFRFFDGTQLTNLSSGGTLYYHRGPANTDGTTTPLTRPTGGETYTFSYEKVFLPTVTNNSGWTSLGTLKIKHTASGGIGSNLEGSAGDGFRILYMFDTDPPTTTAPTQVTEANLAVAPRAYSNSTYLSTTGLTWQGTSGVSHTLASGSGGIGDWEGAEWIRTTLRVPAGNDGGALSAFNLQLTWVEV